MFVRPVLVSLLAVACLSAQDDVAELVRKLHREKDDADIAIVEKIGQARTRVAADGLIEAFDRCATLLFRQEIATTLRWFVNLPDSQQPVLEKLAAIATATEDEDLRQIALDGLGESATIGKILLKKIVDSKASDELRQMALERHVKKASKDDAEWYSFLWNLEQKQRKDEDGAIAPPEHNAIRLLAFEGLLPQLSEDDLVKALKRELDPKIRRLALDSMERREMGKTEEMASWLLQRVDFPGQNRAEAARILAEKRGAKVVSTFLKLAKKRDVTQEDLRIRMASLISKFDDKKTVKKVAKMIGKGKPHEKVFALMATVTNNDDKVLKAVRKCLTDKSLEVRRAAGEAIGARRDTDSIPALRQLLENPDGPADLRIAIEAINAIEGPRSAWLKELAGYLGNDDRDVRNAALAVIADAGDRRRYEQVLPLLEHKDWSTRYLAVKAVAAMKEPAGVGKLVERIAIEKGRMRKHIADLLWGLTAQPFEEDVERWTKWWQAAGKDFKIASEKEVYEAKKKRDLKRLTQRTVSKVKFFGIKVESHRVIFVLDVSGSMLEAMYGREVDGRPAARIDIAKSELKQAVENLDEDALFNIYTFSTGVAKWQEEGIGVNTSQSRQEALTWIERLGASGGTNLYDSVRAAFADQDVDTIFILSDGEPTTGEVIDPWRIREDVRTWNEHRKLKINCIAIGGNLEVLEWLAKDAGGTYLQLR